MDVSLPCLAPMLLLLLQELIITQERGGSPWAKWVKWEQREVERERKMKRLAVEDERVAKKFQISPKKYTIF